MSRSEIVNMTRIQCGHWLVWSFSFLLSRQVDTQVYEEKIGNKTCSRPSLVMPFLVLCSVSSSSALLMQLAPTLTGSVLTLFSFPLFLFLSLSSRSLGSPVSGYFAPFATQYQISHSSCICPHWCPSLLLSLHQLLRWMASVMIGMWVEEKAFNRFCSFPLTQPSQQELLFLSHQRNKRERERANQSPAEVCIWSLILEETF